MWKYSLQRGDTEPKKGRRHWRRKGPFRKPSGRRVSHSCLPERRNWPLCTQFPFLCATETNQQRDILIKGREQGGCLVGYLFLGPAEWVECRKKPDSLTCKFVPLHSEPASWMKFRLELDTFWDAIWKRSGKNVCGCVGKKLYNRETCWARFFVIHRKTWIKILCGWYTVVSYNSQQAYRILKKANKVGCCVVKRSHSLMQCKMHFKTKTFSFR